MTISNELSGDIAVAMLAAQHTSQGKRAELKETVLRIHSLLQEMELHARRPRVGQQAATKSEAAFKAGT